jgi:hypothetical protein
MLMTMAMTNEELSERYRLSCLSKVFHALSLVEVAFCEAWMLVYQPPIFAYHHLNSSIRVKSVASPIALLGLAQK